MLALLLACAADPAPVPPAAAVAPSAGELAVAPAPDPGPHDFTAIAPGLELGVFDAPVPSPVGDSRVTVLRIDPAVRPLELRVASQHHQPARTARAWAEDGGFVAAINPGMFEPDGTSTFFAQVGEHVDSERFASKAGAVLALDPVVAGIPPARLVDLRCDDWEAARARYRTFVQGYRMIGCDGAPTWKENGKIWSHAAVGQDHQGRVLFVHARSPWSTRAFTENLLALPLGLERLMYAEGGPEASLWVGAGVEIERFGSWETGFHESDANDHAWPLPNVLVVR